MAKGSGTVYLRGRTWWIQWWRDGQRFAESTGQSDRDEALVQLAQKARRSASGSVDAALDALMDDYRMHARASTAIVDLRIKAHLRPALGHIQASRLTARDISQYVALRRKAEASDATINRELSALRRGLTLLHQAGKLAEPVHVPKLAEHNVRQGFVDQPEYRQLVEAAPAHIKALIVVAWHTGLRSGELLSIKRAQVDLLSNLIRLPGQSTKNRKPRTVPIYGEMRPWIEMQMSGPGAWLFEYQGRRLTSFRTAWAATIKAAKLPELLFHDLRRSAVRNLERAGVPRSVARAITGHRTEAVYTRYDIVSARDLEDAAKRVEAWFKQANKGESDEQARLT